MMEWPGAAPDGLFCSQNNQSSRLVESPFFQAVAPKATRAVREARAGSEPPLAPRARNVERNQTSISRTSAVERAGREKRGNFRDKLRGTVSRTPLFLLSFLPSSPETLAETPARGVSAKIFCQPPPLAGGTRLAFLRTCLPPSICQHLLPSLARVRDGGIISAGEL